MSIKWSYSLSYFSAYQSLKFILNKLSFSISEGSLGHSLLALEAIDCAVSKDADLLGQDLLLKTQEMMKEFGHTDVGRSPKTEIQRMLLGANRILDNVLSMDIQLIKLKQLTLRII